MNLSNQHIPKDYQSVFENLVDEIPLGILTCDKEGKITAVNDFLLEILGSPSAEATININILTFPPLIESGISGVLSEALLTGKNTSIETYYTSIWGKELFLSFRAFPLKDDSGSIYGCHTIIEDITAKNNSENGSNAGIAGQRNRKKPLCQSKNHLKQTPDIAYNSNINVEKTTIELTDILDCENLQSLFEEFYRLTGHLLSIGDLQGNPVVAVGWQDICTKFHRVNPETCAYCTESDLELSRDLKPNEYKLYKCKNGLWDAITPIFVHGIQLGNIYYGQFFLDGEEIPYDTFRDKARKYGFDEEEYIEALEKVPRVSQEKVETVMKFYTQLTHLISSLSYNNIKLERTLKERDKLLTSLHESESRFHNYVDSAPDSMFITNEKGELIEVNEAACRITGYSREEITGMNLLDMSASPEKFLTNFSSLIKTGSAFVDWDILTKSREKRISNVKAIKLSDTRFLGFARDITEQKMAENALVLSENNFISLFELTTVGVAQVAPDGSFMRVNEYFCEILGYSVDELSEMNFIDITHPDDLNLDMEYVEECVAGKIDSYEIEKRYIHKNGSVIWAKLAVKVVRDANNEGVFAISVITDITLRKRATQELEYNEQKYRTLFEQSNDSIIIHDTNGKIIDFNNTTCNIFGYDQNELKQKSIMDIIAPEEKDNIKDQLLKIITNKSVQQETKMICSDGTPLYIDVSATLLKGHKNLIQAVGRDITDRVRAQDAMLNALIQAETANRTKSEFLANMSHELRTPLNSIIGFSDIMLEGIAGELEEKQGHYLQHISDSGQHLLELINSILDISKIEAGKMDLYYEEFDIKATFHNIIAMMQTVAGKKNIKIAMEVPCGLPMINADSSKIKQVLYNLLGNAIKFTDNNGKITIRAAMNDDKIQISIIDTGIGISDENRKKLFKPFSQIDSSTSRQYTGTGLGLALVKDIVELHGGRIWVESKVNEGSNFTFEIPVTKNTKNSLN